MTEASLNAKPADCVSGIRLCILGLLFSCLLACSGLGTWNSQVYHVHKGETLYAIAWRYGLDYRELAQWNNIPSPYTIYPGQELILTHPDLLPAHRRPAADHTADSKPAKSAARRKAAVASHPVVPPPSQWLWPTRGKVLKTFAGERSASQGIDIGGQRGQSIIACANGKVVYSGSGLAGFGKLIIIKHNDTYISAYAHNDELLVSEGDSVKAGQEVAKMGVDQGVPRLHFEIRRQGRPVDPLKYLPGP